MPLPPVLACTVFDCVYNKGRSCRASAIHVGQEHPTCDTYEKGIGGSEIESPQATVGGCDVLLCRYNDNLSCGAPGITVNLHENHADCETFVPRQI